MRITDYLVTFALNLLSGGIVVALVEVVKWQLRLIQGDTNVRDKVQLWILARSKGILLTGIAATILLLMWILFRFPLVTPGVVIAIVLAVALTSAQLGLYLCLKILSSLFHAVMKGIKTLARDTPSTAKLKA